MMLFTLIVGYFATFNMTYFLYVILSDSEESHRKSEKHMLRTLLQGIAAVATLTLAMTRKFSHAYYPIRYLPQFHVKSVF